MGKFKFTWDKNRDWAAARLDNTYYNKYGFEYEWKRLAANVIKKAYDNHINRHRRRNPILDLPYDEVEKILK